MTESTETDDKKKKVEKKRPSQEEEKEYFRKAAEQDLAAEGLFSKRNQLGIVPED